MNNKYIADRFSAFEPYSPIEGDFKIRLDANESPFGMSEDARELFYEKLADNSLNRYPDSCAEKLCTLFGEFYGVDKDNVVVGNGSDELISLITAYFTDSSMNALVVDPDFSMYGFYLKATGTPVLTYKKPNPFILNCNDLTKFIKENNCRFVILSNPCNPTSLGLNRTEIMKMVSENDALFVIDEAYMDFWNESVLDEADKTDNLIVLKTLSKAFGIAGARVGFAVSNPDIINLLKAVKSPYNVGKMPQAAGEAVLSAKSTRSDIQRIIKNTKLLVNGLRRIESENQGCFEGYYGEANFVLLHTEKAYECFCRLKENSIAVRYFKTLADMSGFIRVCAGTEEETQEFLDVLKKIAEETR